MVGASGAIAGVMGAYMVKFPHSRILTLVFIVIFFTTVEVPAWVMLIYWFVLHFFSGVGSIGVSPGLAGRRRVLRAHRRLHRRDRAGQRDGRAPALLESPRSVLVTMKVMKPVVTLYTRAGCCLCDDAKRVLAQARPPRRISITKNSISTATRRLLRLYNDEVPVIAINGVKAFKYRVDMKEFLKKLAARA